jgi:acyl carrier protein
MLVTTQVVREQLHRHVVETFLFDNGDVDDSASLLDEGIIDSMGVLELVLFLEENFGVSVTEREVVPENFDSIDALTAFVEYRLGWAENRLAS